MQLKAANIWSHPPQSPDSLISTPQKLKSHISWYEMKKMKGQCHSHEKCFMQINKNISNHLQQWPDRSSRKHVELVARKWGQLTEDWGTGIRRQGQMEEQHSRNTCFRWKMRQRSKPSDVHGVEKWQGLCGLSRCMLLNKVDHDPGFRLPFSVCLQDQVSSSGD